MTSKRGWIFERLLHRETLTEVQQKMQVYRKQSYPHINEFIGRLYPNVVVGYLDDSLALFGSITHGLVAQGDPDSARTAHPVTMSITQKGVKRGINIPRDKRKYMMESRAVILGTQKPDELQEALLDLKGLYEMDGILYMTVLEDGKVDDAKYFNHTEKIPETSKGSGAALAG